MKLLRLTALAGAVVLTFGLVSTAVAAPLMPGSIGGNEVAWATTNGGDNDCDGRSVDSAAGLTATSEHVTCHPAITIVKTADPETLPPGGGSVSYAYVVTNTGDVPVVDVHVADDMCAKVEGGHDWALDPGKSWTYSCTTTITKTTINTATATADWRDCSKDDEVGDRSVEAGTDGEHACVTKAVTPVTDQATVTVEAANPRIYIAKSAPVTDLPAGGGEVTFTYKVTNIGNVPISDVTLGDDKCDAVSPPTGDTNDDSNLDLDETWTYTCTMAITETTTNTGTATGRYGDEATIDAAQWTVTVSSRRDHPQIYILKTPSVTELPAAGGPVTFTYLVWNVGNAPLTDVTVVDDKCAAVTGPSGDTGADKILGLDETWTYTCTMTLTATTTNIGTATGYAGDYQSVDADDVIVTVLGGGGVAGETSVATAPPTDAIVPTTAEAGGGLPILLILLGVIGLGAVLLTPDRGKR